ncbi:MAG TPA: superoxide dismutase family protein [bacterium]|jgi:Cu-Zn family superoxide dismutase|nr:superoxide dismutase family protein [bacterium]
MIKQTLKAVVLAAMVLGPAVVMADTTPITAVAELSPTKGNTVHGEVKFIQKDGYVLIKAHVEGLTPGKHGFHIHEVGDCSAPDGSSAKGHFNPTHKDHGAPDAQDRHEGDLGNLNADANGVANYMRHDKVVQLSGDNTIIGRSVIVHGGKDDYKTQPTGNSGARVACGVIQQWHDNK